MVVQISGCGGWACRCSNGGRVDVSNGGNGCGGGCNNGGCDCGGNGGVRLVVAMSRWCHFQKQMSVLEKNKYSLELNFAFYGKATHSQ